MPFESIRLVQGDTDAVSFGRGTFASRSAMLGSACLRLACDEIVAKGKKLAAHILEAAEVDIEFSEGRYCVAGTDRIVEIVEELAAISNERMEIRFDQSGTVTIA